MQTPDKLGIACDSCGMTYKSDFEYLSFDFRQVIKHGGRQPSLNEIFRYHIVSSFDICMQCWLKISEKVINNNKKAIKGTCDISGLKLGETYYYAEITKVMVRMSGQPNVCTKCKTKTYDDGPCKECGCKEFVNPALINTINRFVELNVSESVFVDFRKTSENVRRITGEWTTQ